MTEKAEKKTVNINSIFLAILTAMTGAGGTFALNKIDRTFGEVSKVAEQQTIIASQVAELKQQMKDMVLTRDFQSEISRLNREIEQLKKRKP